MKFGKGYLTYAAGVSSIVLGVYQMLQGNTAEAQTLFVAGLGLLGLRRAIG